MDENRNEDGTFKAGHKGFKPSGSHSEIQKMTRQRLAEFVTTHIEQLPEIFKELNARDKAKLLIQTIEFFLPKQRELMLDNVNNSNIDLMRLSESAIREILNAQQHETDRT